MVSENNEQVSSSFTSSQNGPFQPIENDKAGVVERVLPLSMLSTICVVVFGEYAQDISEWVVCAHSVTVNHDSCALDARIEALMIGTLVTTVVAIYGTASAAQIGKKSNAEATLAVIGSLTGALFVLLKAAAKNASYPQLDLLAKPLFMYFVCVLLFAVPLMLTPHAKGRLRSVVSLYLRISVAIVIGIVIGYSVQLFGELYWKGWNDWGAEKFVIAPSATVIATGAWGMALLDPWLRPGFFSRQAVHKRFVWIGLFGIGAIGLAAAYGVLFYFHDGDSIRGWIEQAGLSRFQTASVVMGLLLPGITVVTLGYSFRPHQLTVARTALVVVSAVMLAMTIAWYIATLRINANPDEFAKDDVLPFVVTQGLTGVIFTILLANRVLTLRQTKQRASDEGQ